MPTTEDDLLKEAIEGTEKEIFNEATDKEPASTEGGPGDRSVEEMGTGHEGQLEADDAGEVEDGEGRTEGDDGDRERDPKTGQFVEAKEGDKSAADKAADETPVDPKARVPLAELITERKARQAFEAQLKDEKTGREADKAAAQSEFQKLNARIDQILSGQRPAQPQAAQDPNNAPRRPDIFEDPDAYIANLKADIEKQSTTKYLEADLRRTHKAHGEVFEKAYAAMSGLDRNDPASRVTVQKIWNSPTPGDDMIDWWKQQEALRVVGKDPTAYAERVRTEERSKLAKDPEFRKALLAEMRGDASGTETGGSPKPVFRMPKSLNSAAGGQSNGQGSSGGQFDGSDRGVFDSAFADQ